MIIAKKQFNEWKPNSKYQNEEDFHIIEFSGYRHINYVEKWKLAKKDIDKNIEKHFLCYNRNMTHPHRLFIVSVIPIGILPKLLMLYHSTFKGGITLVNSR